MTTSLHRLLGILGCGLLLATEAAVPALAQETSAEATEAVDPLASEAVEPKAPAGADWSGNPLTEQAVLKALEDQAEGTCAIDALTPAGVEAIAKGWLRASYSFRWQVPGTDIWHAETLRLVIDETSGAIDEAELERSYAICWDWR